MPREEYISRINRVLDYIESRLAESLTLQDLARVASFSPYHFHRIFSAFTGETLNQFIQRLRLERAATQLIQNPSESVTAIALDLGFSGSAAFARAFKAHFGMSASEWRDGGYDRKNCKTDRKEGQPLSKIWKDLEVIPAYLDGNQTQTWRITMKESKTFKATVEVKELPERPVAYVRHVGPYAGDSALFEDLFGRLCRWAGPRDLLGKPDSIMLTVYHDNPEVTDESKLRTSVCLTVPPDTAVDGEIGKMTVAGGKYAIARFEVKEDEFGAAWNAVFGGWLPESGYQPDDRPCFEICHNNPKEHPESKFVVDICVPVRPL